MNSRIESNNVRTVACARGCVEVEPILSAGARRSASAKRRLELVWAWGSLLTLIICWDAALRLDQHVSPPRVRIAHAAEVERAEQTFESAPPTRVR